MSNYVENKHLSQYFESNNRSIYLKSAPDFGGVNFILSSTCCTKVNEADDTIDKMLSGLNHFLYYVEHIIGDSKKTELRIVIDEIIGKRIASTRPEIYETVDTRVEAYQHLTKFPHEFLDLIVRYTLHSTVYNSIVDNGRETINKPEAMVLSMLSLLLKFTYLINKMLNVGSFTDTMYIVYDSLLLQITNAYRQHLYLKVAIFQSGCDIERRDHRYLQTKDVIEGILCFCQSISETEWTTGNIHTLRNKFDEVGDTTDNIVDLVIMAVISALKKHTVIIKDEETMIKLFPNPEDQQKNRKLSYDYTKHDWDDFACVTLNLLSYIRKTLGDNTKNTAKRKIQTVVTTVGLNMSDDVSSFKSEIYYEANFTTQVKEKKKIIEDLVSTSLDYIVENKLHDELNKISNRTPHILSKMLFKGILVAVYRERDMVSDLTSKYAALPVTTLLDIFKQRNIFPTISKIVNSNRTTNSKYSTDDLKRIFASDSTVARYGEYAFNAIKDCFSTYVDDEGNDLVLTIQEFTDFKNYIHDREGLVRDWYNFVFKYDYDKVIK
ncbi:MAG: hypothetical protein ACRCX2_38895 [Paraclostridium sp.]